MPTIFFYGPELEKDKRRELVKSFTKKVSELTGIDEAEIVVYLRGVDREHVAKGGELRADKFK